MPKAALKIPKPAVIFAEPCHTPILPARFPFARMSGGSPNAKQRSDGRMSDHPGILLAILLIVLIPVVLAGLYLDLFWKPPKK